MGSTVITNPDHVGFAGLLFDMDGTIIDSTDAVVKHWRSMKLTITTVKGVLLIFVHCKSIGNEIGADPEVILQTSHGRRSMDILREIDPSKANWEYVSRMEGLIPLRYGSDAKEINGARSLISSLSPLAVPWAIVTSGTRPLVTGWLSILKLPQPEHLVMAEDVENGKPDPSCYEMGLKKLDMQGKAGDVLVLEDSPAGIRAGKGAGCKVLGVVTTHTLEQISDAGADWVVRDLSSVRVIGRGKDGKGVLLEVKDVLVKR